MVFLQEAGNFQVLLGALKTCSKTRNLEKGKQVHAEAIECGHHSNIYITNALINMYAKCGSMVDARDVFDSMMQPTVISWTTLIMGYAENGQGYTALDLFTKMRTEANSITFVAVLRACSSLAKREGTNQWVECRNRGKEIHSLVVQCGCCSDIYVQSTLIDVYAKCSSMVLAREVFDGIKQPTVVSWNVLILGYADNGEGLRALDIFVKMGIEGPAPDSVTLVAALKACTALGGKGVCDLAECKDRGKEIHSIAVQNGCNSDVYVQSSLVDMYTKYGSMVDARSVFDGMKNPDVVPWTALILGYAENGQGHTALEMFTRMRTQGFSPDSVTFVAALKACISLTGKATTKGIELHNIVVENGFISDVFVQNCLVTMYAESGNMVYAREVFECMKYPDVVSWTVLILGYTDNCQGHVALDMFSRMKSKGLAPNCVTFVAALKACGMVGALQFGRKIHSELGTGYDIDVVLVNCLVDFYAKCGSLVEAERVFLQAKTRDMVTWSALLAGFSSCGDNEAVFGLFEGMQCAGFKPDGITFLCILMCCSHAGLVVKGKECFDAMSTKYGVVPTVEHYTCMIDLFGRVNKIEEAIGLLKLMPRRADCVTWMTILSACRKWKNVEMGRLAFKALIDLNDRDTAAYVLMGQIYTSRGMLQEKEMVMKLRRMKSMSSKTESVHALW